MRLPIGFARLPARHKCHAIRHASGVMVFLLAALTLSGTQAAVEVAVGDPDRNDYLGASVGIGGSHVLVGAPGDDQAANNGGAVQVLRQIAGSWAISETLVAADAGAGDWFGYSIAVNGNTAIVGAPWDDDGGRSSGSAYVFARSGGVWVEQQKLSPVSPKGNAKFGSSVAISSGRLFVGSPGTSGGGTVTVFENRAGAWVSSDTLSHVGGSSGDQFGAAVSASGNRVAVAAPGDNGSVGSVSIFRYKGGTWRQEGIVTASDPSSTDWFGAALSLEGARLAVGAPRSSVSNFRGGVAYVFELGTAWRQTARLESSVASNNDYFGTSLELSGDSLFVGAPFEDPNGIINAGAVVEYRFSINSWSQTAIYKSSGPGRFDQFGASVDADSGTLAVGIERSDKPDLANIRQKDAGSVYLSSQGDDTSAPVWGTSAQLYVVESGADFVTLSWPDARDNAGVAGYIISVDGVAQPLSTGTFQTLDQLEAGRQYAFEVKAIDAAGNVSASTLSVVVRTTGKTDASAPMWVGANLFVESVTANSAKLVWSGATDAEGVTGYRVLAADGTLIGRPRNASFVVSGLSTNELVGWVVQAVDARGNVSDDGPSFGGRFPFAKIIAPFPGDDELFGGAVAIDGNTAVVSALHTDMPVNGVLKNKVGNAYVYEKRGVTWQLTAELQADDGFTNDLFGYDVDIDGDTIVIGAWHANPDRVSNAGAAYVFERRGNTWRQSAKLLAAELQPDADFGVAVAVDGDLIAVGAHEERVSGVAGSGAVHLFKRRSGGGWRRAQALHARVPSGTQAFGRSVAIDRNRLVVGAAREAHAGGRITNGGALYVFDRSGATWAQSARLFSDDVATGDFFGEDVDINGNIIATVARDDDQGRNSGAGYIFEYDGANWQQAAKLIPRDAGRDDFVGFRTSLSGFTVAIGSYNNNRNVAGGGAAYTFRRRAGRWVERDQYLPSDPSFRDNFGIAVAIDGTTLLVGSERDDHGRAEIDAYQPDWPGTSVDTVDSGSAWFFKVR